MIFKYTLYTNIISKVSFLSTAIVYIPFISLFTFVLALCYRYPFRPNHVGLHYPNALEARPTHHRRCRRRNSPEKQSRTLSEIQLQTRFRCQGQW